VARTYAVTGVASGIGAELARILKHAGHRVVGFDLQPTQDNIDQFVQLDLNDPASIESAAGQVTDKFDGLCNNAGLPPRDGLAASILQVNFLGTRQFTQVMVPHLANGASVVNMASRAGHGWNENVDQIKRLGAVTERNQLDAFVADEGINATRAYNLSKEAMILWTLAVTEEFLAHGLRVNSISPGGIATGIFDDFKRAFGEKMMRNIERAGRPGKPEEIANLAAFVLSPQSNWLKGSDIAIDGGIGAFNMSDAMGLDALCLSQTEAAV